METKLALIIACIVSFIYSQDILPKKKILFFGMQSASHLGVNLNIALQIAQNPMYSVSMIEPYGS